MIFGFQFFVIGLLGEMVRYYAFQSSEEYSIRHELESRNTHHANTAFAPAEPHMQYQTQQAGSQPPQDWGQQRLQPQRNQLDGNKHHTRNRLIPSRPTIIPL